MSDDSYSDHANDDIFIQLSPWGGFFVWIAKHVERLRRDHRIVGHLSFSPLGPSASSSSSKGASAQTVSVPSVRLPLQLTLEETTLLLFMRIAKGLDVVQPVTRLEPPSPVSLMKFDETLAQHHTESMEVFKLQKRQKMLSYYGEILQGRAKRKAREAAKVAGSVTIDHNETVLPDDAGKEISKKRLKKSLHRERRKVSSAMESATDYLDDDYYCDGLEAVVADEDSQPSENRPTLEELTASTGCKEAEMAKYIPIHRPRPTPQEWKRNGEHRYLIPPEEACASVEKVAQWLLSLTPNSGPVTIESAVLRCKVFQSLWSKGFYITCSAAKLGGNFLVYQGDPLFHHASHIVTVLTPHSRISLSRLSASLRIANSVRKVLVLATADNDEVVYTSMYWTGARPLASDVQNTQI
uniref:tRNA-intron lyase n=1 Tax=Mesocestoides corti TaxID=53468 RepID=A0A5K3EY11_MESCO